jgi:hypothetical protein
MPLIVENGTGMANADSYVSLADANAYATSRGLTFPIAGADATLAEQALRRATVWLDAAYRGRFSGYRKNRRAQALEWPRTGALDALCPPNPIDPDAVPIEIVQATIEAAVREKAAPGSLSPDVTPGKIISEVAVEVAVSVKYATPGGVQDQRPVSTVIDGILSPLLGERAANLFGRAERG